MLSPLRCGQAVRLLRPRQHGVTRLQSFASTVSVDDIQACILQKDWAEASVMLRHPLADGRRAPVDLYYGAFKLCEEAQQPEAASEVLQGMAEAMLEGIVHGPKDSMARGSSSTAVPPAAARSEEEGAKEQADAGLEEAPSTIAPVQPAAASQGVTLAGSAQPQVSTPIAAANDEEEEGVSEDNGRGKSYRLLSNGDAIIDLHGFPAEIAKIAVQVALEDYVLSPVPLHGPGSSGDLIIVTGRGKHSIGGEAILRPVIFSFLKDDLLLEPMQWATEPGRIRIPASEIRKLRGTYRVVPEERIPASMRHLMQA
mmetsp:Transcript_8041/g.17982  ORF Transcript_8041/g.17982 Transcript_8041/m.17982 type:complete len:312 (+) Transcript_8041:92-1027(+)